MPVLDRTTAKKIFAEIFKESLSRVKGILTMPMKGKYLYGNKTKNSHLMGPVVVSKETLVSKVVRRVR